MFLEYGVDRHGELVHISLSPRGRVELVCPYCGVGLLARKGEQLVHHFAHDGETCHEAARDFERLNLPIWDRFHVYLSAKEWKTLQTYHSGSLNNIRLLLDRGLVKENPFDRKHRYELTPTGKIPFGEATLSAFADFQDGEVYARHNELAETAQKAAFGIPQTASITYMQHGSVHTVDVSHIVRWRAAPNPEMERAARTDLNIYRAQVKRVYSQQLYLLLIEHTAGTLYKLGVTARPIEQRIEEVKRDLKPFIDIRHIEALRLLRNQGAVERYAHHRYQAHRAAMGLLTEYYTFDKDQRRNLLSDLTRLGDRELMEVEPAALDSYTKNARSRADLLSQVILGLPSDVEIAIQLTREKEALEHQQLEQKEAHRQATREGIQAARAAGRNHGRPAGGENQHQILAKYPDVVQALNTGLSLRKAAEATGVAVNTVRRVKAVLDSL